MPKWVAEHFREATGSLPISTEVERSVVQRVGPQLFRGALLDYWQGRCAATGLTTPEILRASHIKPWALCDDDNERLDVYNGLLLAPNLDALFDGGWVTFQSDGAMRTVDGLDDIARSKLGIQEPMQIAGLVPRHRAHLDFHRRHVFRG